VDAYSKVLYPKHETLQKLKEYESDKLKVLKSAGQRYLYEKQKREEGAKDQEMDEEEKKQVDTIDWYDFVVVEKIDLFGDEEMEEEEEGRGEQVLGEDERRKMEQIQFEMQER